MAAGAIHAFAPAPLRGAIVVPFGSAPTLGGIEVFTGSHPVPDRSSLNATTGLLRALAQAGPRQPLLVLVSGGASSLLVQPRPPVTLEEKIDVTRRLLACGAPIAAVNAVRKHLSLVKGGGLLRHAGARPVRTLILSDVVGDDPSVIGSGPTVADPTTYADAEAVLARYGLFEQVAPAVRTVLDRGVRGVVEETLKPADSLAASARDSVIGSNRLALDAAAAAARRLGYATVVRAASLTGDTTAEAVGWARELGARGGAARWCAIAGGETTVIVRGPGRGGRNQEFALAMARPLAGAAVAVLSAGTDGVDGPTDAAGAFVDGATLARAEACGLSAERALRDNDSYPFFDQLGDLLRGGPTGTNVMDVKIAVGVGSSP
jgi:hydroxypyruvate reductase